MKYEQDDNDTSDWILKKSIEVMKGTSMHFGIFRSFEQRVMEMYWSRSKSRYS